MILSRERRILLAEGFLSRPLALAALVLLVLLPILAALAPWIAPQNPYDLSHVSIADGGLPPGAENAAGTSTFLLGTDEAGRDMLSAILYGLRISIGIGIASAVIGAAIGATIGLLSAYAGGWLDTAIMRIVDLQLSFPTILIALVLLALLGQGLDKILIALVAVQWAYYARTVRGSALVERRRGYVEAALSQGLPQRVIMLHHVLPNCMSPLIVVLTVQTAHAIAMEATLSFLGLGLPKTEPSLGLLIANGYEFMLSNQYWISIFPGIALLVLVLSINLVGDRLRDILNPRLER
jgi:peptide/nickel transport system permease protein